MIHRVPNFQPFNSGQVIHDLFLIGPRAENKNIKAVLN